MAKTKTTFSKRFLAVVLSVLMVFTALPFSMTTALAATEQHPDAVTITVKDETREPLEGADVIFTIDSAANGDEWKKGTEKTDSDGCVEVLPKADFVADDMTITASVSKDKFETNDTAIVDLAIDSDDQDFEVVLNSTTINDVTIEGKTLTYNGAEQEIVSITGRQDEDTVDYGTLPAGVTLNEHGKPVATNAGTYSLTVTVKRDGKTDLVETVTTTIDKAKLSVKLEAKTVSYNETEQELVTVDGLQIGDSILWKVDGTSVTDDFVEITDLSNIGIPTAMAVNENPGYEVNLQVKRGDNYEVFNASVTVKMYRGELDLEGLTVDGLDSVYKVDEKGNPVAQNAVIVTPESGHPYTLMYQLNDGDQMPDDNAWVTDIPTVTNAGSYIVWVKAVKDGYNDSDVPVNPAAGAVAPYNVYIAKAEPDFEFKSENLPQEITGKHSEIQTEVNFAAADNSQTGGTISYAIAFADAEAMQNQNIDDYATIDENGLVTLKKQTVDLIVTATLAETDNYNSVTLTHNLSVIVHPDNQGDFILLDEEEVQTYTLGESLPTNKFQVTQHGIQNKVEVFYDSACKEMCNALIGSVKGTWPHFEAHLTWADGGMQEIANRIIEEKDSVLELTVRVTNGTIIKENDQDYYTLKVSFADFGQGELYTLEGKKASDDNEWYKSAVTVKPATADDGTSLYTIAKECDPDVFGDSVVFDDQGKKEHYVYLKDANGAISRVKVVDANGNDLKIDSVAPNENNMTIDIQDLSIIEKIGYKFGFYNPEVNITFTVADEAQPDESGVQKFTCYYTKDENSTASIKGSAEWEIVPELKDGKYTATKTITASELETYRGHISFTAIDKAGNKSNEIKEDNVIIVVDTISPTMKAAFEAADSENSRHEEVEIDGKTRHFFNGKVDFKFTINEANFFEEDVAIKLTKDGQEVENLDVKWSVDETNGDIHYADFSFEGDGDYVVEMVYRNGKGDNSGNVMVDFDDLNKKIEKYVSDVITIDSTDAKLGPYNLVRDENMDSTEMDSQKTVFRVEERNFDPSYFTVTSAYEGASEIARDIKGNPVSTYDLQEALRDPKNWKKGEKTYEYIFETSHYTDGIYNFVVTYNDNVTEPTKVTANFTVDHTAPTDVKIEYAKSPLDTFLEVITLGFYNPSVTVRFTAYDTSAGVESFTWGYTKESGASTINHPEALADATIPAVQDQNDKSKSTAEITLTADEAAQYRGYLGVLATDKFQNKSDKKVDNGNIIVVDTIAPEITVEYTEADRTIGTDYYYNNAVDVTFTVTEANFYDEDVVVTVTKDGKAFDYGTVVWGSRDQEDKTVGKITLPAPADHSGDGHYVITVEYTDRSNNEMVKKYVSDTHTIDTTLPIINVEYQNTNLIDTVKDRDGNDRQYFDDTQTAVVTINEHNFNADEVDFQIVAKDVTGKELDASALNTKSEWRTGENDDIHIITITYPGDANYTFDVDCSDLATNQADDYAPDYFTVDKTDPTNLTVSYSTSVLDTVLESLTFGFYNAKMTVTITADDIISGVHSFMYSYLNATGVSGVNAELANELKEAADIKYSSDGKTATTSFEIPKMVIEADNQFNGTVEFSATDRAKNKTEMKDSKRIVVDNISPTAQVSYNEATNVVGDISYYDGDINATVTINEANFYANDVQVMVSKDGGAASAVSPVWENNSVDIHTGKFTLTGDGDYIVTINYKDKSSNEMTTYTSKQMTIDTDIKAPTYSINGVTKTEEGGAYKGDATISFNYEDQNFDTQSIKLTRTRFDSVEDVTNEFIKVSVSDKGGSGSFEIPSEVENDGIYLLTIGITDKANHTIESHMKFTINRYGSVYEYSNYLASLIKDGGQYIKIEGNNKTAITQDLVITEYNANQILEDSLKILITRDGQAIDAQYTTNPSINGNAEIGESGWYQYIYTIDQENFVEDGVYKITLASEYAASDSEKNESTSVPDNSLDVAGNQILDTINFTVDTTAPEIRNVVNLDKAIVNAQTLDVDYTIVDVGGIKSIEVIVNGSPLDTITEFGDSVFNYSGKFTLHESSNAQTVQIRVTDIAGNVTDTASDDFSTGDLYIFNDTITVSTNFLVRWYANKPLFWGSIAGVIVVAAAICFIIAYKRKKKEEHK